MRLRPSVLMAAVMGGATVAPYYQRLISMFGASLKRYFMIDESSGTTAIDSSPNHINGTYANLTLGQPGIGDGKTSAAYNGSNSNLTAGTNVLSGAAWDECTLGMYVKTNDPAETQVFFSIYDITGFVQVIQCGVAINTPNKLEVIHKITGLEKTGSVDFTSTAWNSIIMSISRSSNRLRLIVNGIIAKTVTGFGTWPVVNTGLYFGSRAGSAALNGYAAHGFLLDREIIEQEAADCFFP